MLATRRVSLGLALLGLAASAFGQTRVTYLANEGVLIEHGPSKVMIDPLFDNGFGQYQLLPDAMTAALFAGNAPFDGVDAVLISHAHADHFTPEIMLRYLKAQPDVALYAPAQAVAALRRVSGEADAALLDRVTGLALELGDDSLHFDLDGIGISAVRVPHSGWPARMTDIENLVFRVTPGDGSSVLHLGDAADSGQHFAAQQSFWDEQVNSLALPPYWFFLSDDGNRILGSRLKAERAIGIHVPSEPKDRPAALSDYDVFTTPGEYRDIGGLWPKR